MTDHEIPNVLRELGSVEPLPADVLARLDARLEAEMGLAPPVRRTRRRRVPFIAVPGIAVAMAAAVVVVVLVNRDTGPNARDVSALSQFKNTTESVAPSAKARASAPSASAGAGATSSDAAAPVRVPAFAGHSVRDAKSVARTRGLHLTFTPAPCTVRSTSRVVRQRPRAGVRAPVGSTITLTATCVKPQPSGS